MPEPQTGQPKIYSLKFSEIKKMIESEGQFGKDSITEEIQKNLIEKNITTSEAEELKTLLNPKPKTRKLQPTKIVVSKKTIADNQATEQILAKELTTLQPELSPQKLWELKNLEKIIERKQQQIEQAQKELEALPTDEGTKRKQLETEQALDQLALEQKINTIKNEIKALKEEDINKKASEKAAMQILQIKEELAVEKEQPLPTHEINRIANKYNYEFEDSFTEWKHQHPYGTKEDYIDFELGLTNQQANSIDFTNAIQKLLPANFSSYNQATQDLILMKLEQSFFKIDSKGRISKSLWTGIKSQYENFLNLKSQRSYVTDKIKEKLMRYNITESSNPEFYDHIINSLIPKKGSPLVYTDQEVSEAIKDLIEINNEKESAPQKKLLEQKNNQTKQEQIKMLQTILAIKNPVAHFKQAQQIDDPTSILFRKLAKEHLKLLKNPKALPLSEQDFQAYQNEYDAINKKIEQLKPKKRT